MALESTMILIAATALTLGHPGFVFGSTWRMKRVTAVLAVDSMTEMVDGVDDKGARVNHITVLPA